MRDPKPSERAGARDYHQDWVHRAWVETLRFERRYGLWLSLALGTAVALIDYLLEDDVNVGAILLALSGAVLMVLLSRYFLALWRVPARMAWLAANEDDPDSDLIQSISLNRVAGGPLLLEFPTRGLHDRTIVTERRLSAIRFTSPVERIVRRRDDLPIEIRLGPRSRLVVKAFGDEGFVIGEYGTTGRTIRAELYVGADPVLPETS